MSWAFTRIITVILYFLCLIRHAEKNPDKTALIWEKDEPGTHEKVTYGELQDMVCRISNVFLSIHFL